MLTRRRFLGVTAAATAAAMLPARALAAVPGTSDIPRDRVLSFFNTHTGERLTTCYCSGGEYQPDALAAINYILRDFRVDEIRDIDPKLLDLLHDLGRRLETAEPFHVISGYRSPRTNSLLRARGGSRTGVASGSLHMVGKAIDIRVPRVPLNHLRAAALSLERGGVGYYPASNFVHVDTGRVRYW